MRPLILPHDVPRCEVGIIVAQALLRRREVPADADRPRIIRVPFFDDREPCAVEQVARFGFDLPVPTALRVAEKALAVYF